MKFEAMTPAHRPLSILGEPRKDLIEMPSYVVAYGNHCTVNERYPRTLAESIELHEEHHFAEYTRHELYKAIIGYRMGELFVEAGYCPKKCVTIISHIFHFVQNYLLSFQHLH